jgi:hypothetical protein
MIYPIWRLSEYTPDNLGLAFTDDGLLLGHTPLIERRDGRYVVRKPDEIARLVKYSFPNDVAVDRLMPGLARVAAALNANDQALARIAAVHLKIPDLPSLTKRNAMVAEDALIKHTRDGGVTAADWNPALHPRAGIPPNPGWFAYTDGGQHEPKQDESISGQSRPQLPRTRIGRDGPTPCHRSAIRKHCSPAIHSMSRPILQIGRSGAVSGPTFGRRSKIGWRSRYRNMTLRAVRWANGRAGEPSRLISVFQPLPPRPSVSRLLRRRSQHGLVCMLLKQRSSRMPYAAPRQKCEY